MSSNSCQRVSTQSLRGVEAKTSLRQCLRNLRRLHGRLRLGHNISCAVPTLSIFLYPDLKERCSCEI